MKASLSVKNNESGSTLTLTLGPFDAYLHLHGDVEDRPVVSGGFHFQQALHEVGP